MKLSHLLTMAAAVAIMASPVLAADSAGAPATKMAGKSMHAAMDFDKLDANKDGSISKDEWPKGWSEKKFDALDTDHDGKLSKAEFEAHKTAMHKPGAHKSVHHAHKVASPSKIPTGGSTSVPPANNEMHPNDARRGGADGAGGWTAQ